MAAERQRVFASASSVTGVLTWGGWWRNQCVPVRAQRSKAGHTHSWSSGLRKKPHLQQELGKVALLIMQNRCVSIKKAVRNWEI